MLVWNGNVRFGEQLTVIRCQMDWFAAPPPKPACWLGTVEIAALKAGCRLQLEYAVGAQTWLAVCVSGCSCAGASRQRCLLVLPGGYT